VAGEFIAQDISVQAKDAGKSLEKSVAHAAKKTGDYLKSDSFDQEVKRVFDGAGKAVRNAGDWFGHKIDSISGKGSQKQLKTGKSFFGCCAITSNFT